MFTINDNFLALKPSYLFSEVAKRIAAFQKQNPDVTIIRMGIGDVTRPLPPAVIQAMHRAVDRQASADTFNGYGPEQGYQTLRSLIAENDYRSRGIDIDPTEIFISDGAKSDTGNILDILGPNNTVALTDPVYPVYLDTNIMAGRRPNSSDPAHPAITLLPCTEANNFVPQIPDHHVDIIYLCFPNNPTGTTLTRAQLSKWVDYARQNNSLILFDSAYEAFVVEPDVPRSIYEIPGAKEVAIEFRSFSKTAGFTGLRCAYTIVPHQLRGRDANGNLVQLNPLWNRRQCTKFNGASIIAQAAAEATYTPEGKAQVAETINYYHRNASTLKQSLTDAGLKCYGGVNSPYLWVKTPNEIPSWEYFDILLNRCHIASTPGVGFGPSGEGFIRLTAFNTYDNTLLAAQRLSLLKQ